MKQFPETDKDHNFWGLWFIICTNITKLRGVYINQRRKKVALKGSKNPCKNNKTSWYQGVLVVVVCSACVITWRWKSATGLAVGTVSQRQGRPSWGGVWRKSEAKLRSDEQKLYIRRTWNGRVCYTKRSPILPEFQGVNTADIWDEGDNAYPRRSHRQRNL